MALINPTVNDFKTFFNRDFKYLPLWDENALYNIGNEVYYIITLLFYTCKVNGTIGLLKNPSNSLYWTLYSDNILNYILDNDIQRALDEATIQININLFTTQTMYSSAFLYLSAHIMVSNLINSKKGINNSYNWLLNSKAVADISGSYTIPLAILNNILFSSLSKTGYGIKYIELIYPLLLANSKFIALGRTLA